MDHINEKIGKTKKGAVAFYIDFNIFYNVPVCKTIYKSFIRSQLGYGDVIYDPPINASPVKLNLLNIMLRYQSQEPLEARLGLVKNSTMN